MRVISEFFASSEGNGSLLNYNAYVLLVSLPLPFRFPLRLSERGSDSCDIWLTLLRMVDSNNFGAGAVGREGILVSAAQKSKQVIVKVDALTEEPFRDEKGRCVRVSGISLLPLSENRRETSYFGERFLLVLVTDDSSPVIVML